MGGGPARSPVVVLRGKQAQTGKPSQAFKALGTTAVNAIRSSFLWRLCCTPPWHDELLRRQNSDLLGQHNVCNHLQCARARRPLPLHPLPLLPPPHPLLPHPLQAPMIGNKARRLDLRGLLLCFSCFPLPPDPVRIFSQKFNSAKCVFCE